MDKIDVRVTAINADEPISITVEPEGQLHESIIIETDDGQKAIPMYDEILIHKGYSPFICDETDTWFEYDNKLKQFVDTGVPARADLKQSVLDQINKNTDDIKELNEKEEIDPTVPAWAKTNNKPNYQADEVGAVDENNFVTQSQIDLMFLRIFGN